MVAKRISVGPNVPAALMPRGRLAAALETSAFFALLLVVAMRPLLEETYASALHSVGRFFADGTNATPALTAWFDFVIWLAALVAVLAAVLRGSGWQWSGLGPGGAVLLLAAIISTACAGNRRIALNACGDWLAALALVMVLANLCRVRRRQALLLAVLLASGLTSAAKCALQVAVEFAETRRQYDLGKEEFWRRQGIALDDTQVTLFERRMDAREATGFFPYSNAQGSYLLLGGFAALAAGGLIAKPRPARYLFILLAAVQLAMVAATGSRGAMAAGGIFVFLWITWSISRTDLRRRWRAVLAAAWLIVLAGGLAVWAVGHLRGGLPGDSLNFRWQYWRVAAEIITRQPWTGTGAANFDRAYLAAKPIDYPEEIKDPHNFLIAAVAQGGLPAGVGLLLAMVGASITAAKIWGTGNVRQEAAAIPPPAPKSARNWILALAGGFILLRVWVLRGYLLSDGGGRAFVWFDLGAYGLLWTACAGGLICLFNHAELARDERFKPAVLGGVLAFLLHNTIDFSLFLPGTLTPFAALAALLLARPAAAAGAARWNNRVCIAVILAALLAFSGLTLIPVTQSAYHLRQARQAAAPVAEQDYLAAAAADPFDPTPLAELAELRAYRGRLADLTAAGQYLQRALERDPRQLELHRLQWRISLARYQVSASAEDLTAALAAARRAVRLYPNSPAGHAELADLLALAAAAEGSAQKSAAARQHYLKALALDAARPAHEIRRWPASRRKLIEDKLRELPFGSAATTPADE